MNKRDTKFVARIIVLSMSALALGLGARIVLESDELTRLLPRSAAREAMILFAPLVSLMALHYTLAIKSFGIRALLTEALVFAFCASLFLFVTLSYLLGGKVEVPVEECSRWIRSCRDALVHRDNYFWSSVIVLGGLIALFVALNRERIVRWQA